MFHSYKNKNTGVAIDFLNVEKYFELNLFTERYYSELKFSKYNEELLSLHGSYLDNSEEERMEILIYNILRCFLAIDPFEILVICKDRMHCSMQMHVFAVYLAR